MHKLFLHDWCDDYGVRWKGSVQKDESAYCSQHIAVGCRDLTRAYSALQQAATGACCLEVARLKKAELPMFWSEAPSAPDK